MTARLPSSPPHPSDSAHPGITGSRPPANHGSHRRQPGNTSSSAQHSPADNGHGTVKGSRDHRPRRTQSILAWLASSSAHGVRGWSSFVPKPTPYGRQVAAATGRAEVTVN